jgi:cytoskeletal protein RodZ
MTDPVSFGEWLRHERQRRTIDLRTISASTKIGIDLLQRLERGDVSRWPGGLYRRAFVRAYATAIGLDPDLVVERFVRAFPEPDTPPTPSAEPLRLELVAPARVHTATWRAGLDVALALAFGLLGWLAAGALGFWSATAVAALVAHVRSVLATRQLRKPLPVSVPLPLDIQGEEPAPPLPSAQSLEPSARV